MSAHAAAAMQPNHSAQPAAAGGQAAPAASADAWEQFGWMPCRLSVEMPATSIRLRDLLLLAPGSVVRTDWPEGSDAPVSVNGQVIGWAEFEVVGDRLAIRFTEMV
jgi:flagellar motor switch/type III secretory pathway protein FliN